MTKIEVLADALYDAAEVATILGFGSKTKAVYRIPEDELVPTRVGPRRGRKMYRGRDILSYMDAGRPQLRRSA